MQAPSEHRESLWTLISGPTVWAVHFLLSYTSAAVYCAKLVGRDGELFPVRLLVIGLTLLALAVIILAGVRGYRRHRFGEATVPHDFDTAADRHRFLGFATLLLSTLSAVATLYVGATVLFIGSCR